MGKDPWASEQCIKIIESNLENNAYKNDSVTSHILTVLSFLGLNATVARSGYQLFTVGERGEHTISHTIVKIPILYSFLLCVKDGHTGISLSIRLLTLAFPFSQK